MNYEILILPILAGLIAQISKFFIKNNQQKFSYKNIFAYSGMPSGHSAIVVSLATIIGLVEGIKSPLFAIAVIFAIIVIRDAIGIRRYLGQHGQTLNVLVKDLRDDNVLEEDYPRLLEKIGHTPLQVFIGSTIGFLISMIGYFIL
jgi:hypothetical protein